MCSKPGPLPQEPLRVFLSPDPGRQLGSSPVSLWMNQQMPIAPSRSIPTVSLHQEQTLGFLLNTPLVGFYGLDYATAVVDTTTYLYWANGGTGSVSSTTTTTTTTKTSSTTTSTSPPATVIKKNIRLLWMQLNLFSGYSLWLYCCWCWPRWDHLCRPSFTSW